MLTIALPSCDGRLVLPHPATAIVITKTARTACRLAFTPVQCTPGLPASRKSTAGASAIGDWYDSRSVTGGGRTRR
jgi:hypothetical protein